MSRTQQWTTANSIHPLARRSVSHRWPRPSPRRRRNARPPANAPSRQIANHSPVHSFHTLLGDLATLTRNVVRLGRDRLTTILTTPTRTQHRALDLLGLTPIP